MSGIDVKIKGRHAINKNIVEQSFYGKKHKLGDAGFNGAVIYTEPLLDFNPEVRPFFNPNIGFAMNKNVSFGGTPEVINNGGTSVEWTLSGSVTFAESGGKLVLTNGNNNDVAIFSEETPTTIDLSNYTAVTMKVDLDTYSPASTDFSLQFDLGGVNVGDPVTLNSFINTSDFNEQSIAIGLDVFNLITTEVDGLTMTVIRSGGSKPDVSFDDIQLEETGSPITYKLQPERGERFYVDELQITFANNITKLEGEAFDKFFGLAALTNGFTFSAEQAGSITFAIAFRTLGDLLSAGTTIQTSISDGTNSFITVNVPFTPAGELNGSTNDLLSFTVNDDLSSLLQLSVIARGGKLLNELGN
jgi:hypothetical protein